MLVALRLRYTTARSFGPTPSSSGRRRPHLRPHREQHLRVHQHARHAVGGLGGPGRDGRDQRPERRPRPLPLDARAVVHPDALRAPSLRQVVGVDPLISIQIVVGFLLPRLFRLAHLAELKDGAPVGYLGAIMILLGIYLFQKGQDFGLFKLAMWAQPVIALCLAQGFAGFLFSERPVVRRGPGSPSPSSSSAPAVSQVYYAYASLGTYGGGLTEVVKGSELGVGFTPPKNLKYQGIESDISNVVSAKMLSMYTRGSTRGSFRAATWTTSRTSRSSSSCARPTPTWAPRPGSGREALPPALHAAREIMVGDIPDYKVVTIHKEADSVLYANNWTETSSRHLNYNDRLFVSIRTDLDHFNKLNPARAGRSRTCTSTSSRAR
jgi:hypothetical protein